MDVKSSPLGGNQWLCCGRRVGWFGGGGKGKKRGGARDCAYRTSQTRPSVAVCFFVLSSLRTSCWSDSDSRGAESCLSLIFCPMSAPFLITTLSKRTLTLPSMSDFTGVNATDPRTSARPQLASIGRSRRNYEVSYQRAWSTTQPLPGSRSLQWHCPFPCRLVHL